MSPEETAGSIERAFGMWGAVGPSNQVLDGGRHPAMIRGNLEDFLSIEKRWDCVLRSVKRATRDTW